MAEVIRMPRMSDTMEEGVIVGWMKEEGEEVEPGDLLAEIETDKATMELESYHEGVLLHIAVKEGVVPINGVIAVIGEEGEDWKAAIEAAGGSNGQMSGASSSTSDEATADSSEDDQKKDEEQAASGASSDGSSGDKRIKASPLARKMAEDAGVSLAKIEGTGDQGRIIKRDIEAYLEKGEPETKAAPKEEAAPAPAAPTPATTAPKPAAPAAPAVQPFAYGGGGDNYEDVPVSQMRKVIARRLGESKFSAPHFYLTREIDMAKVMQLRKKLNEFSPVKLSFNDLVVKAAAAALREHPAVNSSWMGDTIRRNKDINIGVAVAVDEGLLVPVIRYADIKTLSQINTEVREMAGRARNRRLKPEEMQGNTFTISNLGMFGIEEFTAIINPPEACILAVGTIVQKPVVVDGEIQIGHRMKVTMSCDHRVVDGATGAKFLQTLVGILENPIRLLV